MILGRDREVCGGAWQARARLAAPALAAMLTAALAAMFPGAARAAAAPATPVAQAGPTTPSGPFSEDAVKAVFLYRFAGYVQWPAQAAGSRFTIAVLGDDPVEVQLARLLPSRRIHNEPATVRRVMNLQQLDGAQMLYVGPQFTGNLAALTRALAGRPVLVITDEPGALMEGSMLNFLLVGEHVRFEVAPSAAQRSGLKISSDLLAVATHVQAGRDEHPLCRSIDSGLSACQRLADVLALVAP